ncbi:MAG: hypothetical protein H6710_07900 [Myxococcales bacterium]|nr:hypothetical protein [Myxococcales bacterium]
MPQAFHLVGLATVVNGDALSGMTYVPSNFAPAYGNASGGLVVLGLRRGDRARARGLGFLDIGGLGALTEGPVGKGSFLIAARRAHLDLPLRVVSAVNPLAPAIVPTYYDAQLAYDLPLRGGKELHVGFLGSADRLAFAGPEDAEGARASILEVRNSFHRLDLAYRARLGPTKGLLTPALRCDTASLESELMTAPTEPRRSLVSTLRAAIDHEVSRELSFLLGADAELARTVGEPRSYVYGAPQLGTITQEHAFLGLYGDARIHARGLHLELGSRLAAFVIDGRAAFAADPRLRGSLALGARWRLSGGVGLYTQPIVQRSSVSAMLGSSHGVGSGRLILPTQISRGFDPTIVAVEGDLALIQAIHASFGVARRFAGELEVEATGFYRTLEDREDVARPSDLPRQVAFGGELMLRKGLTRRVDGWLAYSLLWAQRVEEEGGTITRTPSPYDQRHNLVAVLSLRLPRAWRLGGRLRLSSGLPYTPVVGAIWNNGAYTPLLGEPLSGRFPIFHQLDVRVDKRWVLRRSIVMAYLDLVNAYNAANTEAYIYSRDFSQRVGGLSLPILPLLGVRVEL